MVIMVTPIISFAVPARKADGTRCSLTHPILRSMTAHHSVLEIEDLPDEMLLHILKFLHLQDLLNAVQVYVQGPFYLICNTEIPSYF